MGGKHYCAGTRKSHRTRSGIPCVVALPPVPQKEPYLLDENGIDEIDILPPVQFSLCKSPGETLNSVCFVMSKLCTLPREGGWVNGRRCSSLCVDVCVDLFCLCVLNTGDAVARAFLLRNNAHSSSLFGSCDDLFSYLGTNSIAGGLPARNHFLRGGRRPAF